MLDCIRKQPLHMDVMVQTADGIIAQAAEKHPMQERPPDMDDSDWQAGMYYPG
jgi:hypothetical protein